MKTTISALLFALTAMMGPSLRADPSVYRAADCTPEQAASDDPEQLLPCYVPVYTVDDGDQEFNRIGTPEIRLVGGRERVGVDPERPSVFVGTLKDHVGSRDVVHLIYRIHFTRIPWTAKHFFLAHRNAGVLTLVTLDVETLEPLFVTTVYTCGCYRALLPTDLLPKKVLPAAYPEDTVKVWGKPILSIVPHPTPLERHLVVAMDSGTHRVHSMTSSAGIPEGPTQPLELRPMDDLHHLPIDGKPGAEGSFFYTSGFRKGHVRGAWSRIEGLTVGLLILDPMIGTDKDFGDPAVTGTRFYTMLTPWSKNVSRLDRFDPLLRKLGYRTDALASADAGEESPEQEMDENGTAQPLRSPECPEARSRSA